MTLDLSPLARAIARLREGLVRFHADESDTLVRDGLIQRFEFAYDLAHKMLRQTLADVADTSEEIDRMTFSALIQARVGQDVLLGQEATGRPFGSCALLARTAMTTPRLLRWWWPFRPFLQWRRSCWRVSRGAGNPIAGQPQRMRGPSTRLVSRIAAIART